MMTDFTIIRRSLRARLFSTVTAVLSVAVAVGLMLVLLSLRDASRKAFERGSGNMHLLISADASPMGSVLNQIFYANAPARALKWPAYKPLMDKQPLEFAIPVQQGDTYRGFPICATTPEFFKQFKPDPDSQWALAEGAFFAAEFEVVLGDSVAKRTRMKLGDAFFITHGSSEFDAAEEAPGSEAVASEYPTLSQAIAQVHRYSKYKVVGILKRTGTSHDRAIFCDLNSTWIVHAHERRRSKDPAIEKTTAADLADDDRLITGIFARCITPPGSTESPVLMRVYDDLRRNQSQLTVAAPAQEIGRLFEIVSNIDQVFLAMAAVVMVSSAIGIMLALYNSMEQRRRQIAVLRVLGCSQPRIFGLIVTEAAMIGLLGAVGGVFFCVAANKIAAAVLNRQLGLIVEPSVMAAPTLLVILAAVLAASLAGLIPAVMAYRTAIARNLRPLG